MTKSIAQQIADRLLIKEWQVKACLDLFAEGGTIPFISRYRKERTGNLDEVAIAEIKLSNEKILELESRKETVLNTIEEQGKMTPELKAQIVACTNLTDLEDLYLPYKPKRKTRATMAREKGLEPLAKIIMAQHNQDIYAQAARFLNKEVATEEDALAGARDIIAEWISENIKARNSLRRMFEREGMLTSKVLKDKEEEGNKYKDYFGFEEKISKIPSHRLLAIRRGEKEGFLRVSISPSKEKALEMLDRFFVKGDNDSADQVALAVKDSYQRLLAPTIETEFAQSSKEKADLEAIKVFALNLHQLLMAAPLGQKRVLAIDPGYRSGCKVVCLSEQGDLLHNETIYPHKPQDQVAMAYKKVTNLVSTYKIEAIAIGNGTASRETESFVKRLKLDREVKVFMVSEDGASVYSASSIARQEFPQYDVTVRGSVSIGRRLMDPLAELVKIDPKSIGVGQYQHDVDQAKLKQSLDMVVESAVNQVGVEVNTASKHLLTYVSGLGPQLAENIVKLRSDNGPFISRKQLMDVPRMGKKLFEQCAGFLRISGAEYPLDNSAVHPESYPIVEKMAKDLGVTIDGLIGNKTLHSAIKLENYITNTIGLPTLTDIIKELEKPGRDPRKKAKVFEFSKDVESIHNLEVGMVLPGIVTNITNFGAFVDVGAKQDGLVHISNMANQFISNPSEVVKLHQHLQVKVIEVDVQRKRIQLSMKDVEQ
ncbi:MAG: RNA-binding transcriptional accessory protein [Bacteroidales bacterium]|nr:RNA-binding transcriptional accessory protein [Bacteroidales bacterium]MCF8457307.1 RNA-binding transcriptional accessory protein [Bacteroidales bacterium]